MPRPSKSRRGRIPLWRRGVPNDVAGSCGLPLPLLQVAFARPIVPATAAPLFGDCFIRNSVLIETATYMLGSGALFRSVSFSLLKLLRATLIVKHDGCVLGGLYDWRSCIYTG